jgi:hypothetical protein
MSIQDFETIWFPGIYHGRNTDEYTQLAAPLPMPELIALVAKRAHEDGEWAIANGLVGENNRNEPKMRRMMDFVADAKNIQQCVEHILAEERDLEATVDWVCRDLANASRMLVR